MTRLLFYLVALCFIMACSSTSKSWQYLKEEDCLKYTFGRIDAKRSLTEEDKKSLLKQGLRIQEFVFENQYLGCWDKNWNTKNLDQTPVVSLNPFEAKDKLASGMPIHKLDEIAQTTGHSMVLIQTLSSVDSMELVNYGKIIFHRDHFYRLLVKHQDLKDLLEYPCLRLMSIVKENHEPDQK